MPQDAALASVADDGPGLALAVPHRRENHGGAVRLQLEVGRAAGIGYKENVLPGLAAVGAAIHAALLVGHEGIAESGHVDDIWIRGVDANGGDLADVAEADEGPRFARVDGLINAAADGHVAACLGRTGAGVDHVGEREASTAP